MKYAFTLLELIFVIIVIGIIATIAIPKFSKNDLSSAAAQVISHIKYTQHLAMLDDKYDATNTTWYRARWQIAFSKGNGTQSYYIFSDYKSDNGNPDANEANGYSEVAVDPLNKNKYLIGTKYQNFYNDDSFRINKRLDLKDTYGVHDIKMSGGSSSPAKRILFDVMGRPYQGTTNSSSSSVINSPVDKIFTSTLYIKLCIESCQGNAKIKNDNEIIIIIEPETGYTHLL